MRGIRFKIYPKERGIHVFQAPSIVQEHRYKNNPKDELLLVDLRNSSSLKFVNNWWSDYNTCTNVPFVY
jgi:hypothetical protein